MRRAAVSLLVALCLLACVLVTSRDAPAHARSISWSSWTLRGDDLSVRVRVSRSDLSTEPRFARLAPERASPTADDERALAEYLEGRVRAEAGAPCPVEPGSRQVLEGDDGFLVRGWRVRCSGGGSLRITVDLLFDRIGSHIHFATLAREGAPLAERLLTRDAPAWEIERGEAVSARVVDFVALGIRHVATGPDHILFVMMLLVAARSLRSVAGVVTGFTLGHSATLALAVLGGVRPDTTTVEALVGASIAVVAVENVWLAGRDAWTARGLVACIAVAALAAAVAGRSAAIALAGLAVFVACYFALLARMDRPERLRWTVAALFGTVHGLAFSGALAEMSLARSQLAGALFGFNVGVEIAQLAIVALAWPAWQLLARTRVRVGAVQVACAAALSAGAFWVVDRAFGAQ